MRFVTVSVDDVVALASAFLLCGLIGFEREARHKDAGIRTHILVGLGSCLFTLVSLEGIPAVLGHAVTWDASRITAQIVTGIGFLGAGVIFVGNDTVRGLTTASAIWLAAAVGVACGSGLVALAAVVVLLYFLTVFAISPVVGWVLRSNRDHVIRLTYQTDKGALRQALLLATEHGFTSRVAWTRDVRHDHWRGASVEIHVNGKRDVGALITDIAEVDGVSGVDLLDRDN